ncbi:DUF3040 domain-containing protein [Actinokineospora diospyrosa]|uniref:DUF3040 family protein n=1 Tax=Actinokineospora diospyrosa TaxID=103728 RepID=A0ABT1IBH1_9PSEU|nr:DUF3040 domain-containing protein [Actinokineospora diospyrosa]MCP2269962.1 Protein of unknown function (DUF3040) [Actinokineospora diospyrosa]
MGTRGLSAHEQRQLAAIEQRLGQDDPDIVLKFRRAAPRVWRGVPSIRGGRGFAAATALLAPIGLLLGLPLLVICAMVGSVLFLLLPVAAPRTSRDGGDGWGSRLPR